MIAESEPYSARALLASTSASSQWETLNAPGGQSRSLFAPGELPRLVGAKSPAPAPTEPTPAPVSEDVHQETILVSARRRFLEYLTGKRRIVNIPERARLSGSGPIISMRDRFVFASSIATSRPPGPDRAGSLRLAQISAGRGTGFAEENRLREKRFCLWL